MSPGIGLTYKKIMIVFRNTIINSTKAFEEFKESVELVNKWTDITIQPKEIKEESEPNAN